MSLDIRFFPQGLVDFNFYHILDACGYKWMDVLVQKYSKHTFYSQILYESWELGNMGTVMKETLDKEISKAEDFASAYEVAEFLEHCGERKISAEASW